MVPCYINCWLKKVFLHSKYIKTQWLVQRIFLKFDSFIVLKSNFSTAFTEQTQFGNPQTMSFDSFDWSKCTKNIRHFLAKIHWKFPLFFWTNIKEFHSIRKKIRKHCEQCKLVETSNQILLTFKFGVNTKSNRICGETSLT